MPKWIIYPICDSVSVVLMLVFADFRADFWSNILLCATYVSSSSRGLTHRHTHVWTHAIILESIIIAPLVDQCSFICCFVWFRAVNNARFRFWIQKVNTRQPPTTNREGHTLVATHVFGLSDYLAGTQFVELVVGPFDDKRRLHSFDNIQKTIRWPINVRFKCSSSTNPLAWLGINWKKLK